MDMEMNKLTHTIGQAQYKVRRSRAEEEGREEGGNEKGNRKQKS